MIASKNKAHSLVAKALKEGVIKKLPCAICGQSPAEAHHEDYTKPLEVIWLCLKHHRLIHAEKRNSCTVEQQKCEINLIQHLKEIEVKLIKEALEKCAFNKSRTAKYLGISFRSLRYRLDTLGME